MDGKKGGLVIDPYCGSGTTLVAAKILGCDFIGIDISREYIESTKKRLENYRAEEKYVNEEMARHVVKRTFKERKENGEFIGRYRRQGDKKSEQQPSFKFLGKYT